LKSCSVRNLWCTEHGAELVWNHRANESSSHIKVRRSQAHDVKSISSFSSFHSSIMKRAKYLKPCNRSFLTHSLVGDMIARTSQNLRCSKCWQFVKSRLCIRPRIELSCRESLKRRGPSSTRVVLYRWYSATLRDTRAANRALPFGHCKPRPK
jgi:hypothetical protein